MTKRTLITTFALATLLLGSLIGVGLPSHQTLAANATSVQAATGVQTNANVTPMTAATAQATSAEADSESETEAPDSAADTDNIEQQDGPQDGPLN